VDESASSTPVITIEIDDKRVSVGAVDLVRVVAALTGIKVEVYSTCLLQKESLPPRYKASLV